LPVTIECCEKNLGVPRHISRFILPLAATINMDGSALFQAVATVFIAQALGVDLTAAQYGIIFGATLVGGVGTAPVPGASMVMMIMVLSMVGLQVEGIALIIGVDRILNMCRATVNAIGDAVIAVLLSGFPAGDEAVEEVAA
jgi:Na+/H+-dicarboxylate symporter